MSPFQSVDVEQRELTLKPASRPAVSSASRVAGFSEGLKTGLALTGGGGSLVLPVRGLLEGPVLLPNS